MSNPGPLRLSLVTAPTAEPVSVGEAKLHARIDEAADDALVQALIVAAREMCETYTRRAFVTQTWKMFLDAFPDGAEIELPRAPLIGVTHIKTYDDADAETVFAAAGNYFVDTAARPGRIVLRDAASWPSAARVANAIEIQFAAGYGPQPSDVPGQIRQAILMTVAELYEHRNATVTGTIVQEISTGPAALLSAHRDWLV